MSTPQGPAIAYMFGPGWGYGSTPSSFFKCQWPEVESAPELSTSPQAVGISTARELALTLCCLMVGSFASLPLWLLSILLIPASAGGA